MKFLACCLSIYITLFATHVSAQDETISYKLDVKMARKILIAIDGDFKDMPSGSDYNGLSLDKPTFYLFSYIFDRGAHDYWAVNPWTGDAWNLWMCQKLTTPASLKLQDKIRQRFTADEITQYDRLSALKPHCWN